MHELYLLQRSGINNLGNHAAQERCVLIAVQLRDNLLKANFTSYKIVQKVMQLYIKTDLVLKSVYKNHVTDMEAKVQAMTKSLQKLEAKAKV